LSIIKYPVKLNIVLCLFIKSIIICKQKGIIEQPNTSWSSAHISHNKSEIFYTLLFTKQKQHVILEFRGISDYIF
jgi:hypothetical protein